MNLIVRIDPTADECSGPAPHRKQALSFEDAVAAAIGVAVLPTGVETVPLLRSLGRVLAEDVVAETPLPRFEHSAMDGYAVDTSDFVGAGPWILQVSGRVAAGDAIRDALSDPMQATEIYTGGELPVGSDAVVVWERCTVLGNDRILIAAPPRAGDNVRRRGQDVVQGTTVAPVGSVVTPHVAALLASLGMAAVAVRPKIRVGLLTTGNELRSPGEELSQGQIYDSNRLMAAGVLDASWIDLVDLGALGDDRHAIQEAVDDAANTLDVLITSGGMSYGAADHVRASMAAAGGTAEVLSVAMRPGKPAMKATGGLADPGTIWETAIAEFDCFKREGRTEFVPVAVARRKGELPALSLLGRGSSGNLFPMACAAGVAMLRADMESVRTGDVVEFHPL